MGQAPLMTLMQQRDLTHFDDLDPFEDLVSLSPYGVTSRKRISQKTSWNAEAMQRKSRGFGGWPVTTLGFTEMEFQNALKSTIDQN
jgi:hypothetical protein